MLKGISWKAVSVAKVAKKFPAFMEPKEPSPHWAVS
jgi:hypothetical protein